MLVLVEQAAASIVQARGRGILLAAPLDVDAVGTRVEQEPPAVGAQPATQVDVFEVEKQPLVEQTDPPQRLGAGQEAGAADPVGRERPGQAPPQPQRAKRLPPPVLEE